MFKGRFEQETSKQLSAGKVTSGLKYGAVALLLTWRHHPETGSIFSNNGGDGHPQASAPSNQQPAAAGCRRGASGQGRNLNAHAIATVSVDSEKERLVTARRATLQEDADLKDRVRNN